jgi:excisionase family DNA binding protein
MEPFFLTINQTAEQLQISTKTVRRMLLSGRLPGKRIGTLWRISAGALLTFMDVVSHGSTRMRIPTMPSNLLRLTRHGNSKGELHCADPMPSGCDKSAARLELLSAVISLLH